MTRNINADVKHFIVTSFADVKVISTPSRLIEGEDKPREVLHGTYQSLNFNTFRFELLLV